MEMFMENKNGAPIIQAVGLSKTFRDFWNRPKARAVNDVDFTIRQGEVVGLLGPNGSGKSTTVKMLLGLLYPTAGALSVFGLSPRDVETKKRIGYLPEETYLYKYLSAGETLDFFGSLFNISKDERRDRCAQLLDMVGLTHARNRRVGEFSKGMARRVGLAQAMINDPDLLILDEPTSGLDPIGCREVKDLIKLLKSRGKTVLVTSHLLSDVEDVCDRVIILYGGEIRATGTLDELLTVPDASRITTPLLSPDATKRVIEILRRQLDGEDFKIDHPRMTLENFFLNVVEDAKRASVSTAGVTSGAGIAEYLTKGDDARNVNDAVLRDLTAPAAPPAETDFEEPDAPPPKVNEDLERLLEERQPAPNEDKGTEPDSSGKKERLDEANEKLRELLGGKD